MRPFRDSATLFQVLQAAATVQLTTRMQDHVQQLLVFSLVMTLAESGNSPVPYTMETPTQDILVKTGVQVRTGLVFHGRMLKETFQETLQHKTITSGIQMPQRLQFQFLMKVQRTEIQHNKQMTLLQSKKHTITALLLVSSQ